MSTVWHIWYDMNTVWHIWSCQRLARNTCLPWLLHLPGLFFLRCLKFKWKQKGAKHKHFLAWVSSHVHIQCLLCFLCLFRLLFLLCVLCMLCLLCLLALLSTGSHATPVFSLCFHWFPRNTCVFPYVFHRFPRNTCVFFMFVIGSHATLAFSTLFLRFPRNTKVFLAFSIGSTQDLGFLCVFHTLPCNNWKTLVLQRFC